MGLEDDFELDSFVDKAANKTVVPSQRLAEFKDWIPIIGRIFWLARREYFDNRDDAGLYGNLNNIYHVAFVAYSTYKLFLE